jgi:enoyl-CoA hydratase/carnithine racemase
VGEHVTLQVEDEVATIRIDRPPLNAIDLQVMEGLRETAAEVAERDDVGAVVLYGGEKVFAAGADVKMLAALGPEQVRQMITAMQEAYDVVEAIRRSSSPPSAATRSAAGASWPCAPTSGSPRARRGWASRSC